MPLSIHRTNVLFQVLIPRIALRPRIDNAPVQLIVNDILKTIYMRLFNVPVTLEIKIRMNRGERSDKFLIEKLLIVKGSIAEMKEACY